MGEALPATGHRVEGVAERTLEPGLAAAVELAGRNEQVDVPTLG